MSAWLLALCLCGAQAAPEDSDAPAANPRGAIALQLMAADSLEGQLTALSSLPPSAAVDEAFLLLEALVSSGRTTDAEVRAFSAWWAEGTPIRDVLDRIETGGAIPGAEERSANDALAGFSEARQRFTVLELSPLLAPPLPLETVPDRPLECPVSISLSPAGELEGARAPSCPQPWAEQVPPLLEAWTWPAPKVGGATVPALVSAVLVLHPEGEARLPEPPDPSRSALPWLSAPEREAAQARWEAEEAHLVVDAVDGHWEVLDGEGNPIDALAFADRIGDEKASRRARRMAAVDQAGSWIFVGAGAAVALCAIIPLAGLESPADVVAARYEVNPALYDDEQAYLEAVTEASADLRDAEGYFRSATARDETRIVTAGALVLGGGLVAGMAPAHSRAAKDRTPAVHQVFRRRGMEDRVLEYNSRLRQELGLPPVLDLGALLPVAKPVAVTVRWGGGLTLTGRFR